jgi:hypothetical protein
MFSKIQNPETGKWVNVNGVVGKRVLHNYIKQMGGNLGIAPECFLTPCGTIGSYYTAGIPPIPPTALPTDYPPVLFRQQKSPPINKYWDQSLSIDPTPKDPYCSTVRPDMIQSLQEAACEGVSPGNPSITKEGSDFSNKWGKDMGFHNYKTIHIFGGEKKEKPRNRHFETGLAVVGVVYSNMKINMANIFYFADRTMYQTNPHVLGEITLTGDEYCNGKPVTLWLAPQITAPTPSQKKMKKICGAKKDDYGYGGTLLDHSRRYNTSLQPTDPYYDHISTLKETHLEGKRCIMSKREAVSFSEGVRSFIKTPEFELANKPDVKLAMTEGGSNNVRLHLSVGSDTACNALRTLVVQLHDNTTVRAHPLGFNGIVYQGFLRNDQTKPYVTFCPNCNNKFKEWESEQEFHTALSILKSPLYSSTETSPRYPITFESEYDYKSADGYQYFLGDYTIIAENIILRHSARFGMCKK